MGKESVQKHLSSSLQPIWFDLQTKQNITGQFYSGCRDWSLEKGRLLERGHDLSLGLCPGRRGLGLIRYLRAGNFWFAKMFREN